MHTSFCLAINYTTTLYAHVTPHRTILYFVSCTHDQHSHIYTMCVPGTSLIIVYLSNISTGWCTYYTCLKRLSTFFTIVVVGTDYCLWMTGSPPSHLRFHLLNAAEEDAIRLCVWFKDTNRKDVYKVSSGLGTVFIQAINIIIT